LAFGRWPLMTAVRTIGASHNVAALRHAIYRAKHGQQVYSFHYVCGYGAGINVPARVVLIAFLHLTDESIMDSANTKYDWFTGMRPDGLHGQRFLAA
jgi:hypothetical protein